MKFKYNNRELIYLNIILIKNPVRKCSKLLYTYHKIV